MVEQVNKLIFNTLCAGRDIYLPQVGSLVVRRVSASLQGSKRLVPPRYNVTLTGEQRGESLVEIIAQTANVTTERAEDICRQWINAVKRDGVVTIENVGRIEDKKFDISPLLHSTLNPHSLEPITLKPRTNWAALASVTVALLVVVGVVVWQMMPPKSEIAEQEVESVAVVEPNDSPAEPNITPEPALVAEVTEPAQVEVADPTPTEVVAEPEQEIGSVTKGKSYIVWGVYSQLDNARKYKDLVEGRYEDVSCTIYHYKNNTLYMVALQQTDTRNEAIAIMRSLKERGKFFEQIWICTL